jgi:hypothetical protein
MGAAAHRFMSDSRQSPIPQDRVNENVDQAQRAKDDQSQMAEQERYLKDHGVDERPGTNPQGEPGISDEPTRPAEGRG